tara:strand:+ start:179 stop:298 length:120 start_codon:yes stop_codon:yes gene_type:complete
MKGKRSWNLLTSRDNGFLMVIEVASIIIRKENESDATSR